MTDKELRRLQRADLLEILFRLQTEVETLREEKAALQQRLDEKTTVSLSDAQMQQLMTHLSAVMQQQIGERSGEKADE